MAKKKLDILQKLSTVTAAMGNIIDSLTGNSTTDAPSIRAVNEALNGINTEIENIKDTISVVENDLKSENPTQNAPNIQAVLDNLQHKQLLINNDFQIWQRGTSFEQYDSQYTADMWKATCGVEKVDNGVKLIFDGTMTSGQYKRTIQQFIPNSKLYSEKKASIGISIDGVAYEVKGTFLENQDINGVQETIDDLEIVLGWSNSRQMYTLIIRCSIAKTVIINYVDLFEGDIAYPHIKEDEDIALMKCQRRVLPTASTVMGYTGSDSRYVYIMCEKLKNMIDTPTVTGFTEFVLKINGVSKNITINNAVANIETGEICLDVGSGNLESNRNISGFMNTLILTNEPL